MSNTIAYVDNQTLTNIADAVRYKTGTNGKMLLSDIPDKIRNIEGIVPTGTQTITENGEYDVLSDKSVTVDVNPDLRPLSVSENGTYEPDGFDGFRQVSVDVSQKITYDEIASGTKPSGDIVLTVEEVIAEAFRTCPKITGIYAPNCKYVRAQGFMGCSGLTSLYMPNVEVIEATGFSANHLQTLVLPSIKELGNDTFAWSPTLKSVILGKNLERVGDSLLRNTSSGWVCKFLGTPTSLGTRMFYNASDGDIYVPWSEGEVANAPWGATGATVHYNTIYDENWNVISST